MNTAGDPNQQEQALQRENGVPEVVCLKMVSKVGVSCETSSKSPKKLRGSTVQAQNDIPYNEYAVLGNHFRITRIVRKWCRRRRIRPPLSHAAGAKMTVVKQTPSKKQHLSQGSPEPDMLLLGAGGGGRVWADQSSSCVVVCAFWQFWRQPFQ